MDIYNEKIILFVNLKYITPPPQKKTHTSLNNITRNKNKMIKFQDLNVIFILKREREGEREILNT